MFLLPIIIINIVWSNVGALEEDVLNSPEGLVLVQRASDQNDVVIGSHIRGARLRSSSASFEEVDLLLPGTARQAILSLYYGC